MEASHGPSRRIIVVLPAFNEAPNIGSVLDSLERVRRDSGMAIEALVVDDGSRDCTSDVVRRFSGTIPCTLLQHSTNLGLGASIRDGLLKAADLAEEKDVIITMDADDTHTPAAIGAMIAKIDQGYDILIASRYQEGSRVVGVPLTRRFLSRAASILFRTVFPIAGVRDFTCGYRAYRASVLQRAVARYRREFINQEGFQCMVDILLKLRRMNLRFGEVPIVLRYDQKEGSSKMKILPTIVRTLVLLARRRVGL